MPFLVRRGTDSQRLTITPAQGEIIYTTDTKNVFVGDGTTLGGNQITGTFAGGTLSSNLNTSTFSITNGSSLSINGATGAVLTTNLSLSNNTISITDGHSSLNVQSPGLTISTFTGITSGSPSGVPYITVAASRGTISAPTTTNQGDIISGIAFRGYTGSQYTNVASIVGGWSDTSTLTNSAPGSQLRVFTGNNAGGYNTFIFNYNGVFSAPVMQTGSYAGSAGYPASPSAGMIIFDSSNTHFYGYNGSAWKQLDN